MLKRVLLALLFFAGTAWAEPPAYYIRSDCASIITPPTNAETCLQTTTASGRTAGREYVWNGAAWVDRVVFPSDPTNCSAGNYPLGIDANGNVQSCTAASGGGTVTQIDTTAPISGGPITTTGTITCDVASGSQPGCLSSADWTTFNNKGSGTIGGSIAITQVAVGTGVNTIGGDASITATQSATSPQFSLSGSTTPAVNLTSGAHSWSIFLDSSALGFFGADVNDTALYFFNADNKILGTQTSTTLNGLGAVSGRQWFSIMTATDGTVTDAYNNTFINTDYGQGGIAAVGSTHNLATNLTIEGSGSTSNEFTPFFSHLDANIGTGFTQTAGPVGRLWGSDQVVNGPIAVQPGQLNGITQLVNNFYNGSPADSPSGAMWIVTKQGAGAVDATHAAANTFPVDVGLGIVGFSTGPANGFTKGIQIGGNGSGWMESGSSKIGTGIYIVGADMTTNAIQVDAASDFTVSAAGLVTAPNIVDNGLTASTPVYSDSGKQLASGAFSGNTTTFVTTTGTQTSGDCVKIDANGNHVANGSACGGSGSPGGSDTQVQFNDGGSFGGDAGLVYNKTTDTLTAGQIIDSGLTASRLVASDGSKQLTSSISSADLASSISDETGTTLAVFNTDPALTRPVVTGTPAAQAALGYDTTNNRPLIYDGAWGASIGHGSRIPIVAHPAEQLTNSTASDQDFTSLGNIPANFIIANRVIRLTLLFQFVSDNSASSLALYLKLGSTKVMTGAATAGSNNLTRSAVLQVLIFGTAAAGASANVDTAPVSLINTNITIGNSGNTTSQPVALATNGALAIVPGIAFSTSTNGESVTLLDAMVEVLN